MKVSIIIPNYNGQLLLKNNLPKVLAARGVGEIIVVDDASTDASVSVISRLRQDFGGQANFKFLRSEKNLGFSSTVNRGVKMAKGDIIVLLNTDVVPEKNFLEPLLTHFSDTKVFAVGCLDKSIEKGKVMLRGRGVGKFKRGFLVHKRGEVNKNDTLWVSGGSGAFRKSIWDKLGGFDEVYDPFYWEDIDICYRAQKAGYKIVFEPKSIVVHEHELGSVKKHYKNFQIRIIAYRNQFIFVWKNITDFDKRLLHFLWLPWNIISAILRGDLYFLIGLFLAVVKLPTIVKESFKVQKLFTIPDKNILR